MKDDDRMLFDVNKPAGIADIARYVESFAGQNPRLAEWKTRTEAPRGYSYLIDSYRRRSGDMNANPFDDAARLREDAIMQAAQHGASVSVGGQFGSDIIPMPQGYSTTPLSPAEQVPAAVARAAAGAGRAISNRGGAASPTLPVAIAPPPAAAPAAPVATLQQMMSPWAAHEAEGQASRDTAQRAADVKRLRELPMSANDDPNHLWHLYQRGMLAGVTPENAAMMLKDRRYFQDEYNPELAGLMRDKSGKLLAGENLHPIYANPDYQTLLRTDPDQAERIYAAFTPGVRNVHDDVTSFSELRDEQRGNVNKVIEGIKNPYIHPVTGEVFHTTTVKNASTQQYEEQSLPIDDRQKAALAHRPWKSVYGFDIPGSGGLMRPKGMTDAEYGRLKEGVMEELGPDRNHPTAEQVERARVTVQRKMLKAQNAESLQAARAMGDRPTPDLLDWMAQFDPVEPAIATARFGIGARNLYKAGLNIPLRFGNVGASLLGSDQRLPLIQDMALPSRHTEGNDREGVMQWMADMLGIPIDVLGPKTQIAHGREYPLSREQRKLRVRQRGADYIRSMFDKNAAVFNED